MQMNLSRPASVTVEMADGQPYILRRLLSAANHKQEKAVGYRSVGLILTPRATAHAGRNLCPFATPGCARSCFAGFDRLAWPQVKRAAVARTLLLARDPHLFRAILAADIARELAVAGPEPLVVRLNVVSDVAWERDYPRLFADFPTVQFMDYTKDISRILDPARPRNYHLTFSRSEENEEDSHRALVAGHNVTVVFRKPPFPTSFWGYPVIDGDRNDLRFLDPAPCIVGLKAKGAARRDGTGFVVLPASNTDTFKELTEDEFDALYPLIPNHLNPSASWTLGEGRGCLFETYGDELAFVRQQDARTIWTLFDGEDGDLYLGSGYHLVNRIGYLISTVPAPRGVTIQVHIPMETDGDASDDASGESSGSKS